MFQTSFLRSIQFWWTILCSDYPVLCGQSRGELERESLLCLSLLSLLLRLLDITAEALLRYGRRGMRSALRLKHSNMRSWMSCGILVYAAHFWNGDQENINDNSSIWTRRACSQHSQNAIFRWNFQKYLVKLLFLLSLSECVWRFRNNAFWDTH